jgi:hypothetical protein
MSGRLKDAVASLRRDGEGKPFDEGEYNLWRVLALAQEGASFVSECLRTVARITPGDPVSWYNEWSALGKSSEARADLARNEGNLVTAAGFWLRASNYYRSSERLLSPDDSRSKLALKRMRICSQAYLSTLCPRGEVVEIPNHPGRIKAYFLPGASGKSPVVICLGGADDLKDDQLYRTRKHALVRELSLLLIDFEGEPISRGRRSKARYSPAHAISSCIDYLESRPDVDANQIALLGSGLGASYAWTAANLDDRLRAVVCDGGLWELRERAYSLAWMAGVFRRSPTSSSPTTPWPGISTKGIRAPLLVTTGARDYLDDREAAVLIKQRKRKGLRLDFKSFSEQETGVLPGHVDNPTLSSEFIFDWIRRQFAEKALNSAVTIRVRVAKKLSRDFPIRP